MCHLNSTRIGLYKKHKRKELKQNASAHLVWARFKIREGSTNGTRNKTNK